MQIYEMVYIKKNQTNETFTSVYDKCGHGPQLSGHALLFLDIKNYDVQSCLLGCTAV
jgi:hypothetical protein